jgi:putative FmdB family regulatory protein
MPLYEYYCSDCRTKFEMLVNYALADDVACMKCRSNKVRRLLSVFASPRGSSGEDAGYEEIGASNMGGSCGCGGGTCGCH